MAPEYIVHGQLTEKADIYSYGIVVLEIITGRKNQNSISTSAEGHSLMQQVKFLLNPIPADVMMSSVGLIMAVSAW